MKKGIIVCLAAAGAVMASCGGNQIKSLYGRTLTYQEAFTLVDEIGYVGAEKTEREYFNENFKNNIDWAKTIETYPSLTGIDQNDADKAMKLITDNLKTNIESLKPDGKHEFKNYTFKIDSKEKKTAVVNNGETEKTFTVEEEVGETDIKLMSEEECYKITVGWGDKTKKNYTSFEYSSNGGGHWTDFTQAYKIFVKNQITIGEEKYDCIPITATPNFVK